MASSMGREESQENNAHRGGAFTVALTEGLTGKADLNKDGVVYLNELDAYVTDRVKEVDQGAAAPGDRQAHEHPVFSIGQAMTAKKTRDPKPRSKRSHDSYADKLKICPIR